MDNNSNKYFSSHDLPLVAFLSFWYPIESIDRTNQKVEFVFLRNEELDRLIQNFWRRETQIEPLAYFNQIKIIKSRIYGQ